MRVTSNQCNAQHRDHKVVTRLKYSSGDQIIIKQGRRGKLPTMVARHPAANLLARLRHNLRKFYVCINETPKRLPTKIATTSTNLLDYERPRSRAPSSTSRSRLPIAKLFNGNAQVPPPKRGGTSTRSHRR